MQNKIKNYIITDNEFYKAAMLIIYPVVLQSIINQGVNMMDTIMVGRLGEISISAASLANQFYSIFLYLCMGLSAAGLILSAQYWGSENKAMVKKVFDLLIQLIFVFSLAFSMVSFLFSTEILSIYTKDAEVIQAGAKYLKIMSLVYFPHGVALVVCNIMRSVGNARIGLYVSLTSFAINIGFNYIFIFGKLGFPAMGVAGAALGTFLARMVELCACTFFVLKCDKNLNYKPLNLLRLPRMPILKEFFRFGLPAIISDTILAFAASAIGIIIGHMGREFVSAYSIVVVVDRLCIIATAGLGSAAGIMVGQSVGAGKNEEAKKRGFSFLIISAVLGVLGMAFISLFGTFSIALYDVSAQTVQIAKTMMLASALLVPFQNISTTLGKGVLRGGGDTKFLMVADVIFQWIASIPLGYFMGVVLNVSPFIVLLMVRIDYVIKAVWFVIRLAGNKWIHQISSPTLKNSMTKN